MDKLEVGQRIDVVNIFSYGLDMNKTYVAEVRDSGFCSFYHAIDSFGNRYKSLCASPDGFSKIGTFIVKSLKGDLK